MRRRSGSVTIPRSIPSDGGFDDSVEIRAWDNTEEATLKHRELVQAFLSQIDPGLHIVNVIREDRRTVFILGLPQSRHNQREIETNVDLSPLDGGLGEGYTVYLNTFPVPDPLSPIEGTMIERQTLAIVREAALVPTGVRLGTYARRFSLIKHSCVAILLIVIWILLL